MSVYIYILGPISHVKKKNFLTILIIEQFLLYPLVELPWLQNNFDVRAAFQHMDMKDLVTKKNARSHTWKLFSLNLGKMTCKRV